MEGVQAHAVDLLDAGATAAAIAAAVPEVVYHLAGQASVPTAWERPAQTFALNVEGTLNVLEAVRTAAGGARVVLVGSGEVYGPPEALPVAEDAPLHPQNPYAVSKAAADLVGGMYADSRGMDVVRTRSFNHAGPGQSDEFVVGTLARQVAEGLRRGDDPIRVVTGSPEPKRDFTDVRDVVAAYRLLGAGTAPSGVYNVCSGRATSVAELLDVLRGVAGREIAHSVDPARVRAHEVMEIRGDPSRLRQHTGWQPRVPLERTLADAVEWWRIKLSG